MSRSPTVAQITRLQKLAALQSDAARQAMSPLQQERARLLGDIESVRGTLRQSQTAGAEPSTLVGQSLSAQRYGMWCQTQLAGLQMALARLEVKRIPLAKAMARSEARRLVLGHMADDTATERRKTASRAIEDSASRFLR